MSCDVDPVSRSQAPNRTAVSRSVASRELFGFLADFFAQKPNNDSESEQSYNSDDSEFNYNPGYTIDATIKHVK